MKKKNGFIATSILYSFFLVFIALFIALILTYIHNQLLLSKINDTAKEQLDGINNTRISDLEVGDYVSFKNKTNIPISVLNPSITRINGIATSNFYPFDENSTWIVAEVNDLTPTKKQYIFISSLSTLNRSILTQMKLDRIPVTHPATIELFNYLNEVKTLKNSLAFQSADIQFDLVNASLIKRIREASYSDQIKEAILNVKGDYIVKNDLGTLGGYEASTLINNVNEPVAYYNLRAYSMTNYRYANGNSQNIYNKILNEYCGANIILGNDNISVNYLDNNIFGYVNVNKGSESNGEGYEIDVLHKQYVDYCYYASPVPYNHNRSDQVVEKDEVGVVDKFDSFTTTGVYFRVQASVVVDSNNMDTSTQNGGKPIYLAGGKGLRQDPYIMIDGSRQA